MKALILVDIQKDFCKNGALEVKNADEIITVANAWIKRFSNDLVIATKDWHPASHKSFALNSNTTIGELGFLNGLPQIWWPIHCIENSLGASFHEELLTDYIDKVIYKGTDENIDSYSAFFDNGRKKETELDSFLKENNIDELYILGLATDYCVKYTVLDALSLGYRVNVIESGCKGVNLSKNDSLIALNEMRKKGATIIK